MGLPAMGRHDLFCSAEQGDEGDADESWLAAEVESRYADESTGAPMIQLRLLVGDNQVQRIYESCQQLLPSGFAIIASQHTRVHASVSVLT